MSAVLFSAFEYAIIFPGIFMCIIPVADWLIIPQKKLYPVLLPICILVCLVLGYVDSARTHYSNLLFFPLLAICLTAYFLTVKLSRLKLLYLFLCAAATLSFGCIANNYIIAHIDADANVNDASIPGMIIQYVVSIVIMSVFILIKEKLKWIFENFNARAFWCMAWTIPAMLTFCNVYLLPIDYKNIRVGRVFQVAMVIEVVLLVFFIIFQLLLYQIALITSQKIELETSSLMYQAQAEQYVKLQSYLEQTRNMRHDFKHAIAVISELTLNEKYDELRNFTADYTRQISTANTIRNYCKNPAVNAVVSYYDSLASACNITTTIEISIEPRLQVPDVDLCLLLGNLLENAINSCKVCDTDSRYIRLSCDTNTEGALYITMVNSLNNKSAKFCHGSGTGLLSIRATTEKYNGITKFYQSGDEYVSNIMLKYPPHKAASTT